MTDSERPLLSVITLTIPERAGSLAELTHELERQRRWLRSVDRVFGRESPTVEHVVVHDLPSLPGESYGEKMRRSLLTSSGRYVCWLDDDDLPGEGYVQELLAALALSPDVVTLTTRWAERGTTWSYRANCPRSPWTENKHRTSPAQHFCAWRRELALSAPWLPYGYGAEMVWSECLNRGHPNLSEVHVSRPILVRRWTPEATRCQRPEDVAPHVRYYAGGLDCWRHRDGRLMASLCGSAERGPGEPLVVQDAEGERLEVPDDELRLLGTVHVT